MTDNTNANVDPNSKPEPTQAEKDAASAAAYRAQLNGNADDANANGVEGEKPQRPEHIPEKFWDAEKGEVRVEELAKSYAELEKRGKAAPKPAGESGADTRTPEEKAAEDAAAQEWTAYRESMTQKIVAGEELTDDDYAVAAKKGLAREDVDTYVEGLKAIGELRKQSVYKEAGGEDSYKAMIEWARATYTPAEVQAYDRDVHSGDPAVSLNAVRGLAARYRVANGSNGVDVTANTRSGGNDGYRSKAEMVRDMQDPKYARDSAHRAMVARKIAAARAAGVDLSQ